MLINVRCSSGDYSDVGVMSDCIPDDSARQRNVAMHPMKVLFTTHHFHEVFYCLIAVSQLSTAIVYRVSSCGQLSCKMKPES